METEVASDDTRIMAAEPDDVITGIQLGDTGKFDGSR